MDNRVEFQLQFGDDEAIVDELTRFFAPVATPYVWKEEEKAVKAWETAIVIVLTIVGEWATQRYVLNPLADRTEEWIKGIFSAWEKSKSKRSFNIIVKFGQDADTFEVQISDTSDQEVLKQVWGYIGKAHQVAQSARKQGTSLDKIRILPNGTQRPLVIGYESNRPKYTINLEDGSILQIPASSPTDEPLDPEVQLWLVEQLIRRLAYLRMLVEKGYSVPKDEIPRLEREIEDEKAKLKPR
jgi:hypothetical protein